MTWVGVPLDAPSPSSTLKSRIEISRRESPDVQSRRSGSAFHPSPQLSTLVQGHCSYLYRLLYLKHFPKCCSFQKEQKELVSWSLPSGCLSPAQPSPHCRASNRRKLAQGPLSSHCEHVLRLFLLDNRALEQLTGACT